MKWRWNVVNVTFQIPISAGEALLPGRQNMDWPAEQKFESGFPGA